MKAKILTFLSCMVFTLGAFVASAQTEAPRLAWNLKYEKAMEKAKSEDKILFIYFTGSDWCVACKYMDRDVLSKPEFIEYANANLSLLLCDFPEAGFSVRLPSKQNEELKERFNVEGFPTIVLVNPQSQRAVKMGFEEGLTPRILKEKIENFAKASAPKE